METAEATMIKPPVIFNGKITIESPKGGHRTFSIKTQEDDAKFAPGKRVIALLAGPDNENSYKGFGFVNETGIYIWNSKKAPEGQPLTSWQVFGAMIWNLANKGEESSYYKMGYRMLIEKKCLVCNRTLTTPESIANGIGPICAGKSAG
jgi:hypothetical protein